MPGGAAPQDDPGGDLRAEMRAVGRALAAGGLVRARSGNLSARAPEALLVTAAGAHLDSLTPVDIVVVGETGPAPARATSELALHRAIYAARPEVGAVIHTHSPYATAWSCVVQELVLELDEAAYYDMGARVAVAAYAPPGSAQLAANARDGLGAGRAVLLRRHGAVAVGADLADALCVAESLEHQAQVACILGARMASTPGVRATSLSPLHH